MRKNLFIKSFALMALSLAALSCAKEGADADSQQSEVSFSVEVPAAPATKGLSDASTTNELICQVFLDNKDKTTTLVPELTQTVDIDVTTHKASVKFSLVKGNSYTFIFWAQTRGTGYYETSDLRSVKMNCDVVKANDPTMDAFCETVKGKSAILAHGSVILRRVLAQVNFGTVIPHRTDALKVTSSLMTLTKVPDTFHPLEGKGSKSCEGSVEITFQDNTAVTDEKLNVEGTDYDYISTAYVFAPGEDRIITDASTKVTLSNGNTTTIKAPNAPVKRNCRTNILGDLLTVDGVWNITVSPGFDGGDINYDEISSSLGNGGNETLSKDYSVTTSEWSGIRIPSGVESTLNLNGHRFANENGNTNAKAALVVKGKLTINGDGEVYCEGSSAEKVSNNAILVREGGHLIINGGSYSVGKDAAGKCNSTIYVENYGKTGKVEIYGGTFTNEKGSNGHAFVLNQDDEITECCFAVYGGTFIGFNPAEVNENEGKITSFVPEGYVSTKISDTPGSGTYEVTKKN